MDSKIISVGDNGSDLGEGDSNMDPDCVVEKLSASMQSCEPFCTPQVDSFQSLVVGPDTLRTDVIAGALDDISIEESSGQKKNKIDTIVKDDVAIDSKSKGPDNICSSLWPRNGVSIGSQLKTVTGRPLRKCKKLSNKQISRDIKIVELSRKRRSFSNKARISNWGSLESIGDVFNQTAVADAGLDQNENRKSRKAKGREGDVKRKINQVRTSLLRSKKKIHASTNRIRLKVTFGGSRPLDVTPGVVDDHKNSSSMQIKSTIYNEETERKLEQGILSAPDGHEGIAAQKVVGLFEEAVAIRCLDPGTSPDSEVINLIPEGHTDEKFAEYDILNKQTSVTPGDALSPSLPMKCSRKGKKKNKNRQNCNTNNIPRCPDTIDHTGVTDQHRHFARMTDDALLNEASMSTTSRNISVKISSGGELSMQTPLQSSVVTDCGGLSETFKAEDGAGGGSCSPTGFQHKTPEKSCPLPEHRDGANTINSRSPRSRLEISEAKSPGKKTCFKKGGQFELKAKKNSSCAQAVSKNENYSETGIHTLTDHGEPIAGCSIIPDASNVNMNGVKDEHVTPRNAWVSCDNCYKWRRIPAVLADSIEDTKSSWICKDNVDKEFADCSIPQEKSNAEINAELDISDASCEEDAGAALHEPSKFEKQKSTVSKHSSWKLIKLNHFLHRTRKTQTIDEIMVCHCKAPSGGRMGCGNGCLNRMLNIECVKGTCPCGEHCSNNQFQKRKYAKLKCFRSGKKGCGLQLLEDIREGQFLIEYVGEVLDMNAYEDRQKEYALKGHKHFYFMTLNGSEVIDACAKGNLGRFINHSCEPNCRTEKWMVNGEVCVGLFAIRDIKKGEEVTFDYNYVRVFGAAAKKCVCGSSLCRGYIGGDPSSDAIIVQDDSDEEDQESVMVCEDSDDMLDTIVSASNSVDVTDTCYAKKDVGNDARVINNLEVMKEMHTLYGLPKQRKETNMFKSSGIEGYVQKTSIADHEFLSAVNLDGTVSSSASMQAIDFMAPEDGKDRFIQVAPPESCLAEEQLNKSSTTQSSEISATKSNRSSMDNTDIRRKFKHDVRDGRNVVPASHHKTKVSNSVSSVKNGKPRKSDVLVKNHAETGSKLHHLPYKSRRPVDYSPSDPFEAVQVKLNELLDVEGGISKKKDASRGYLKLLFLTAASENSANGEAIQSNRDLSMILDALLKTKSRTVLADVINKNGLQMLHNIMKRCRKEFHKIPILRKLLKVLEYLAVKEILTPEHITSGPRFAGVESFRVSILSLTEHDDKQVHKIARTFRDKWIRRPIRNKNYMDADTGKMDFQSGASNCNRSAFQSPCDMGVGQPGSKERIKTLMGADRVNCENLACCSVSCSSECVANKTSVCKRKSQWDQPADSNLGIDASQHKKPRTTSGSMQVSISSPRHGISGVLSNQAVIMYEEKRTNRSINYLPHPINITDEDGNGQNIDEDIPPGFSTREGFFVSSSASSTAVGFHQEKYSCPEYPHEVVRGHPQKMFISRLPVSFGIPLLVVEQFGRPLVETSGNWVVAAGIPFHPYPPLPTYPHDRQGSMPASSSIITKSAPVFREGSRNCATYQSDHSTSSTSDAAKANLELNPPVNQHNSQRSNGASNCLNRRYFRQQKWSNTKSGRPWVQGRAGRGVLWNSQRNGMNSIGIGTGPSDLKGPTSSEQIRVEVGQCGNTFSQHLQQNN